jgi:hypothetical protein
MDTETSDVIERINARIDALETTLRGEMSAMRDDLRGEMSAMRDDLRSEIRSSLAEAKRHAVILNEDVRDDIRMLAENLAAMSVKLDSLQR